ncbi:hypothetical protein [Streptomyces sp. NPDC086023]|uniref:hypothetical protein n=1 Tax=Streptomyces sp. NPDC086023 TaxID=3365746 RepID=UPI0037D7E13F
MRYTRPAFAIATTLLALTGITTAHADNSDDEGNKRGGNSCFIHVEGNHNHNACRDIEYGDNATTGQAHSIVGLGTIRNTAACPDTEGTSFRWQNSTDPGVPVSGTATTGFGGFRPGFQPPATLNAGDPSVDWCATNLEDINFTLTVGGRQITGTVQPVGDQLPPNIGWNQVGPNPLPYGLRIVATSPAAVFVEVCGPVVTSTCSISRPLS